MSEMKINFLKRIIINIFGIKVSYLRSYFEGKTIAIIGNAESILNFNFGSEIDQHDIVIRINNCDIKDPKSQGWKIDIWASSYPLSERIIEDILKVNIILWMSPKLEKMPRYSLKLLKKTFLYPYKDWKKLYKKIKARPTTGMMLVDFVTNRLNPLRISLYGFDFFKTKNINEEEIRKGTPHDFKREELIIRKIANDNEKVKIRGYI